MMVSDQQFEQTSTGVGVGPAGENRTGGELGGVPVLEVGGSYRWLRLIQLSTQRLKTSGESEVKTVEGSAFQMRMTEWKNGWRLVSVSGTASLPACPLDGFVLGFRAPSLRLDVDKNINDYAHHQGSAYPLPPPFHSFGYPPPPPFHGFGYPPSRTLHIASVYPPEVCKSLGRWSVSLSVSVILPASWLSRCMQP